MRCGGGDGGGVVWEGGGQRRGLLRLVAIKDRSKPSVKAVIQTGKSHLHVAVAGKLVGHERAPGVAAGPGRGREDGVPQGWAGGSPEAAGRRRTDLQLCILCVGGGEVGATPQHGRPSRQGAPNSHGASTRHPAAQHPPQDVNVGIPAGPRRQGGRGERPGGSRKEGTCGAGPPLGRARRATTARTAAGCGASRARMHPTGPASPLPVVGDGVKSDEEAGEEEQRLRWVGGW